MALIGFPNSGKTTVGKALATALNYAWADSDQALQAETGLSPEALIESRGLEGFRQAEQQWLQNWWPLQPTVLSTGGGLPCYHHNLQVLKERCWTVYLNPDYTLLEQRLYTPPGHNLTRLYSPDALRELHRQRHLIYTQADLCLVPAKSAEATVTQILAAYKRDSKKAAGADQEGGNAGNLK